jgi:hypothetical protein
MNYHHDIECCYCDSTLYKKGGRPQCSGDNLAATKTIFDSILRLEHTDISEFNARIDNLVGNESNYDLFITYWERKRKDPGSILQCISGDTYFIDINEEPGRLPIPDPYIPFPDLAEVYIAEIMLGRELTEFEKDGRRWVPKIDQITGQVYFAPLKWIRWALDYISMKDMVHKTDYTEPRLTKVFDISTIRDFCSGRDGYIIDK